MVGRVRKGNNMIPNQHVKISLRSDLLGSPKSRKAQYKWLKWLEKTGLLAVYLQAMYETNVTTRSAAEVVEQSSGTLRIEDFKEVCRGN